MRHFLNAITALAMLGSLAACATEPVFASDAVCQPGYTLPEVQAALAGQGAKFAMVPPDEIGTFLATVKSAFEGGAVPDGVTNVVVAAIGDYAVFGIETDGCMSPPIPMPEPQTQTRYSGALPDGRIFA